MSTGKMVAIAAAVILLLMGIIGACLFTGEEAKSPEPAAITMTASQRLAQAEDDYADLARELQTLQQQHDVLQRQNSHLTSLVSNLESRLKALERER